MKKTKAINLCTCALFAALTAVLSQIAIPIGPVPINLATFSVFVSGALLGAKFGAISQAVYIVLGAVGVPVFSMFKGGLGVLLGPTGGYIIGYLVAAWLVGLITEHFGNKIYVLALAMLAGFFAYMTIGTCWFMFSTKNGLLEALTVCVVPFLLGDALKIILATALARRLRPVLQKYLQANNHTDSKSK